MLVSLALYSVYHLGYAYTSLLLTPLALLSLWQLRRDPHVGAVLCWQAGVWSLEYGGSPRVIEPLGRRVVTPWFIYLAYTEVDRRRVGGLWLYVDSLSRQQQRQLRVRMALLH